MKTVLIAVLAYAVILDVAAFSEHKVYPDRWFYVSTALDTDQELARIEGLAQAASEHGLNGMLLSARFDSLDLASPEFVSRLQRL